VEKQLVERMTQINDYKSQVKIVGITLVKIIFTDD